MYREIVDMYAFPDLQVSSYYALQNIRIKLKKISLTTLVKLYKYPISLDINERIQQMTDISKYKSLAVSHDCYDKIGKIAKNIAPGVTLSRAQTVKVLVDEKVKKLNGKLTKSISKSS
jgi:hypothetical protein